jgi:pyridoxamine 5'-phosphate oxidase
MIMKFTLRQLFTAARHRNEALDEKSVDADPIRQFQKWFAEARAEKIIFPEAMTLATTGPEGKPSARMVLLKAVDERGFIFYTNYLSAKSKEIEAHPHVALVFHWDVVQRQVRIVGTASRISGKESDAYFATRPRESQLGAHASPQSEVVLNRQELDAGYRRLEELYRGKTVPRPPTWGGYCVTPSSIEFWKGRIGRLHDRIVYERDSAGKWRIKRLAP